MKITIYELLGMIKDGKAPSKIKYINSIWKYDKETKDYFHDDLWLIYSMNSIGLTEREVEIIEEDNKIEKLDTWFSMENVQNNGISKEDFIIKYANYNFETYFNKINEIIDKLNKEDLQIIKNKLHLK